MIPKKIQNSIWFNGLLLAAAVFLGMAAYRAVKQATQFSRESEENKEKIERLLKKKEELEARLTEFQAPEVKERSAKERLNLKKIGEEVVVVLPEEAKEKILIKEKSFWHKIKSLITNE